MDLHFPARELLSPYSVVRGSSVLMGESFPRRQQPKQVVFMSPQRELGGASVTGRQAEAFQHFRLLLDTAEGDSVMFIGPPN